MPPRKSKPTARRARARKPLPPLQFSHPLPYGAVLHDKGVQFVLYSRSATAVRVLLYDAVDATEPAEVISLDPATDRWGDIWSVFVPGLAPGQLYHFQADGPFDPERGQRFDGRARLVDPYARPSSDRCGSGPTACSCRRCASSSFASSIRPLVAACPLSACPLEPCRNE